MIRGINHITLAVRSVEESVRFYTGVLGFELLMRADHAAYFLAGDLWLCVAVDQQAEAAAGYTHIAFDIALADFPAMAERIRASGAPCSKIVSRAAATLPLSATSHTSGVMFSDSAAVSSIDAGVRPSANTRAPAAAKRSAAARPIPPPPPVTTTILPFQSICIAHP